MAEEIDLRGYQEGLRAGELRSQRCLDCHRRWWPPRPACTHCRSSRFAWEPLPPTATVFTWTVVGRTELEEFRGLVPYPVAVLEFPGEAVRVVGRVEAEPDDLAMGQVCRWEVRHTGDGELKPVWTILRAEAG